MVIMIVDDSIVARKIIKDVLTTTVDRFCECSDGAEAIAVYNQCQPDIVLMDIKMKEMDGITATEAIVAEHPKAKVVIVTQYNDPRLREKAKQAGAIDFVLKEKLWDIQRIIQPHQN